MSAAIASPFENGTRRSTQLAHALQASWNARTPSSSQSPMLRRAVRRRREHVVVPEVRVEARDRNERMPRRLQHGQRVRGVPAERPADGELRAFAGYELHDAGDATRCGDRCSDEQRARGNGTDAAGMERARKDIAAR